MHSDVKIVAIGGGTGLSILLRGIKKVTDNVTAVVNVSDDGGGSGVLREDLGMLPPGDIRNCILALANKEPILMDLLNYRFEEGMLKGQNFGNLMLAALVGTSENFEEAVKKINSIFAVTGTVLPVSSEDMILKGHLENGTTVIGESKIPRTSIRTKSPVVSVSTIPERPEAVPEVIEAIDNADIIIMGPGSLFTSIIPNLLVEGVVDAIKNSMAKKVLVVNLMSQPGETDDYSVGDYYRKIIEHSDEDIITHVVVNTEILTDVEEKLYEEQSSKAVPYTEEDRELFKRNNITVIEGDFVEYKKGYIRHDAYVIAKELVGLIDAKIYRVRSEKESNKYSIDKELRAARISEEDDEIKVMKVKF